MPTAAQASLKPAVHIHQIYIKAEPETIWEALTSPEWNGRYGYRGVSHYELKPGGKYRCMANEQMRAYGLPEVIVDGEVIEAKPPFRLVQTYRFLFTDENKAVGFSRITFEIEKTSAGFCRVTITNDTTGLPKMTHATQSKFTEDGGGGWDWILSDLKSLLETGKAMS